MVMAHFFGSLLHKIQRSVHALRDRNNSKNKLIYCKFIGILDHIAANDPEKYKNLCTQESRDSSKKGPPHTQ